LGEDTGGGSVENVSDFKSAFVSILSNCNLGLIRNTNKLVMVDWRSWDIVLRFVIRTKMRTSSKSHTIGGSSRGDGEDEEEEEEDDNGEREQPGEK
jgi:hypothetical protein